jgi:hypothetical protein
LVLVKWNNIGIDEPSVDHEFIVAELEGLKIDDSITDDDAFQIDLFLCDVVVGIDQHGKVRDVLSGVSFTGYEEAL